MSIEINNIAVLTSGGDAPGMNAAIRAVTRTALYYGKKVFGVYRGYEGMIENDIVELNTTSVKHILALGGTFLKSARSQEFRTPEGRAKAAKNLKDRNIDALVVIGGDGSFTGALKLAWKPFSFQIQAWSARFLIGAQSEHVHLMCCGRQSFGRHL